MSHSNDKPAFTISKNGVAQTKPSDILRSSTAMQQIRKTSEVAKRVMQSDAAAKKDR